MGKPNITVDFDDTLCCIFSKLANNRLQFFQLLAKTSNVYIVTARNKEHVGEIKLFLNHYNIQVKGIISDCSSKVDACKSLKSIAHFDDSELHCRELSENGVNCFHMGEFHSEKMKQIWKDNKVARGVWKYYVLDNNTRGME
jgi:hypothetical protein